MKKLFLLSLLAIFCFSGCSAPEPENTESNLVAVPYGEQDVISSVDMGVDYDLTAMSSTMISAQVYNIVSAPSDFVGKTFKINGTYEEHANGAVKAIIIYDALACCAQGLEIRFPENITPPEPGADILIKGVADAFEAEGNEYCYIQVEEMEIA